LQNLKYETKKYPTFSLNLKDHKGEIWKDIPGFEDEYQLSNYGRVKSQARWVNGGNFDYSIPERIRKLHVLVAGNRNKDLSVQLTLHKHGKRYRISVARYTYHLFVAPFDLEDHTLIITRKHGNALNCHCNNLMLRSIREVAKEGFATNKRKSQFQLQIKPVTQYDPNGNRIASYSCTKEAAAATGIKAGYINGAARTKLRMAGGFYWRYGKPKEKIRIKKPSNPFDLQSKDEQGNTSHYYFNRSTKNINGENWKAIDGFEGLYEISDHGRVKSLRRLKQITTETGNKTQYWTKEFIMKQVFRTTDNKYIGEELKYLTVSLKKDGAYSSYTIARLVFQTFSEDRNALDTKFIIHKDGDKLNNHISNLIPATHTEVIKASYAGNRRSNHYANLTKEQRLKYAIKSAKALQKPVTQYNLRGEPITVFDSVKAAAESVGVNSCSISNAINGRVRTIGGFIWRTGSNNEEKKKR